MGVHGARYKDDGLWNPSAPQWAATANTGMNALLEDGNGNQTALQSRIFEPPQLWSINAGD